MHEAHRRFRLLAALGVVCLGVACSSSDEGPARACVPGASVACVCTGGAPGAQVCSDDGSRLEVCVCAAADVVDEAVAKVDVAEPTEVDVAEAIEVAADTAGGSEGVTDPGSADDAGADEGDAEPETHEVSPLDVVEPDDVSPEEAGPCLEIASFLAVVIDFQTRAPLAGANVQQIDGASGQPVGNPLTSDASGVVQTTVEACSGVGSFRVRLAGQRDTYSLHVPVPAGGQAATLWSVSNGTYVAAPALAGISMDESKGLLIGGLYFVNAQAEYEGVGCATIGVPGGLPTPEAFATANIRYLNDAGLPTTLAKQSSVNAQVPFFIVGNLPVQKDASGFDVPWVVTAQVDGQVIGQASVLAIGGAATIADIFTYTSATAPAGVTPILENPMPPGCGW